MSTAIYDLCGLVVRSELELPLPITRSAMWEVDIVWGQPVNTSEPPAGEILASLDLDDDFDSEEYDYDAGELDVGLGWWYRVVRVDDGYIVRFHDCGEVRISADLAHAQICPDRDGRHEILPILMAGTVAAVLLALRGHTVLHASAVAVDDRAIAFVAPSGGGKSTLAALLCRQGAELVTDDVLVVDSGPPARCTGGATELRLRPAAASLANGDSGTSRATADGRTAFAPGAARTGMLPLAAIILPWPSREASEIEVTELPGVDRLLAVMQDPRVFGWTDQNVLTRDLSTLGQVVNQIPVLEVTVPWGPPFDPKVINALLDLAR